MTTGWGFAACPGTGLGKKYQTAGLKALNGGISWCGTTAAQAIQPTPWLQTTGGRIAERILTQ